MLEVLKEKMNKSNETYKSTSRQWNKMKKTVQDFQVERESTKKARSEGNLEMKNLRTQIGVRVGNFKRIHKMENRISDIENKVEELDTLVKENVVFKNKQTNHNNSKKTASKKHPGNPGHHKKTKSTNNSNRRRRNPDQRDRKSLQQNHKRKIPNLKNEVPIKPQEAYRTLVDRARKEMPHDTS